LASTELSAGHSLKIDKDTSLCSIQLLFAREYFHGACFANRICIKC
jgi:hypothetical protein